MVGRNALPLAALIVVAPVAAALTAPASAFIATPAAAALAAPASALIATPAAAAPAPASALIATPAAAAPAPAFASIASPASAAPSNLASTHAFILANYAFVRVSEGRIGPMQSKAKNRVRALLKQCRGAAAGSPENEEAYQLGYEAAGALWSAAYRADAGPIATLARATAGLRWSNARTAHAVKRYVGSLQRLATLPSPPVCKDIATWKASGFQAVPASTRRFDARLDTIEATPVPTRLLAPYLQPGDGSLLRRMRQSETRLLNAETMLGGNDWYALTEGLDLNP